MKATFRTILIFVAVLAALLGISALMPEAEKPEQEKTESAPVNEMQELGATLITLNGETAHITGLGATSENGTVTVVYPGTYRVTGTFTGQLVVDCGDFEGSVYLLLDGADITNPTGSALSVEQCDLTTVYLAEGSENSLRDGTEYTVLKSGNEQNGACILSDDDLVISGAGTLTVYGNAADGIRSRDGLTVENGTLTVYAAGHGIQGSDYVEMTAATVTVGAYGDGIRSTQGDLTVDGTVLDIASAGDGLSSEANLYLLSGDVTVTTCGGADNYAYTAENLWSAKGLKAKNIEISDGTMNLNTAEDGIHGDETVTLFGGHVTVSAGDDAISSDGAVTLVQGDLTVEHSYEGIEGASVRIEGGNITLLADKNAVQTGEEGFFMTGGSLYATAPRCIGSDGVLKAAGGSLCLTGTDPEENPMSFMEGSVTGATLIVLGSGLPEDMLYEGAMPQSLAFSLKTPVTAGTQVLVSDVSGQTLYVFPLWSDASFIQIAGGAFGMGQDYTLTVGETTMTGTLAEECTVVN